MEKQSATMLGQISNLIDGVKQTAAEFGDSMKPFVEPAVKVFSWLFDVVQRSPALKTVISILGGAAADGRARPLGSRQRGRALNKISDRARRAGTVAGAGEVSAWPAASARSAAPRVRRDREIEKLGAATRSFSSGGTSRSRLSPGASTSTAVTRRAATGVDKLGDSAAIAAPRSTASAPMPGPPARARRFGLRPREQRGRRDRHNIGLTLALGYTIPKVWKPATPSGSGCRLWDRPVRRRAIAGQREQQQLKRIGEKYGYDSRVQGLRSQDQGDERETEPDDTRAVPVAE